MSTLYQDLEERGLYFGRQISASKTPRPGHVVFFNACIFDKDFVQAWGGDIDFTDDLPKLQKIASERQQKIYVTKETPFRWEGLSKRTAKKDPERVVIIEP